MAAQPRATAIGFLAIVCWSTTAGLARGLMESLGPYTYLAVTCSGGGLLLFALGAFRRRRWVAVFLVPRAYLVLGGLCFVFYMGAYCVAFHLAESRETVLQLNLVNYLWPAFTLAFAVPFFGRRARWWLLILGAALALTGAGVATLKGSSLASLTETLTANALPFALMFLAAVTWALYNNLAKKFGGTDAPSGMPIFICATGALFAVVSVASGETPQWSPSLLLPLAYVIAFPTALAYLCWEIGMKRGNLLLLGSLSYLIPVTSTLFACWYLGVTPRAGLLLGALLCVAGSFLSRKAVSRA